MLQSALLVEEKKSTQLCLFFVRVQFFFGLKSITANILVDFYKQAVDSIDLCVGVGVGDKNVKGGLDGNQGQPKTACVCSSSL